MIFSGMQRPRSIISQLSFLGELLENVYQQKCGSKARKKAAREVGGNGSKCRKQGETKRKHSIHNGSENRCFGSELCRNKQHKNSIKVYTLEGRKRN